MYLYKKLIKKNSCPSFGSFIRNSFKLRKLFLELQISHQCTINKLIIIFSICDLCLILVNLSTFTILIMNEARNLFNNIFQTLCMAYL